MARKGKNGYTYGLGPSVYGGLGLDDASLRVPLYSDVLRALFEVVPT